MTGVAGHEHITVGMPYYGYDRRIGPPVVYGVDAGPASVPARGRRGRGEVRHVVRISVEERVYI